MANGIDRLVDADVQIHEAKTDWQSRARADLCSKISDCVNAALFPAV